MIRRFWDWIGGWHESWALRSLMSDESWMAMLDDLDDEGDGEPDPQP